MQEREVKILLTWRFASSCTILAFIFRQGTNSKQQNRELVPNWCQIGAIPMSIVIHLLM